MAHLSRDGAGRGSLGCSAMFRFKGKLFALEKSSLGDLPRVFRYVPLDRLRRSRPPLQWNGCRFGCVASHCSTCIVPLGREFFC